MTRKPTITPGLVIAVYLAVVMLTYGHAYWKFRPCQDDFTNAGLIAGLSAAMWPMYISYIAFAPADFTCAKYGEQKK